jgi:hypothetical protein
MSRKFDAILGHNTFIHSVDDRVKLELGLIDNQSFDFFVLFGNLLVYLYTLRYQAGMIYVEIRFVFFYGHPMASLKNTL